MYTRFRRTRDTLVARVFARVANIDVSPDLHNHRPFNFGGGGDDGKVGERKPPSFTTSSLKFPQASRFARTATSLRASGAQ